MGISSRQSQPVGWSETRQIKRNASAPSEARQLIRQHVEVGTAADAALLMASEITTNAVRYGEPATPDVIAATLTFHGTELTVEVVGCGSVSHGRDPTTAGGFGLAIVDRLSTSWGIEEVGQRVRVWFTLEGAVQRQTRG
jgi:two-component sensor histidine kinase